MGLGHLLCARPHTRPSTFVISSTPLSRPRDFPGGSNGQESACMQSLGQEDNLEKGMAAHSSILAWRIPWTEEPGGLLSVGCIELDRTEVTEHATCTA